MKKLSLLLFAIWVGLFSSLFYISKAEAHPPNVLGHPRPTSDICRRGVSDLANGTLSDGRRYVVRQYSVEGDDYANAHYNEPGSVISNSAPNCAAANAIAGALWQNDGTLPTTGPSYVWSGKSPEDVWLGTPSGYYPGPAQDTGFGPRPPANIRGIFNASFGTHFAEVNDAAEAQINGGEYYCVGMPSLFFPSCLGANAHVDEPLGCDCWGYLNDPNWPGLIPNPFVRAIVNKNVSLTGYYGVTKNASNVINPFNLTIFGMNTQDNGTYGLLPGPFWALKGSVTLTFIYPPVPPDFTLSPSITCNIDAGTVTFNISKSGSDKADGITVKRSAKLNNAPARTASIPDVTLNDSDFPWTSTYTFAPPPALGQTMDASITVSPGSSTSAGVGADITESCPTTTARGNSPYFRVYGADVIAGPGITNDEGACSANPNAQIRAVVKGSAGAGSQFAVSATGLITDFISSSMHVGVGGTNGADPNIGLSFGNYGSSGRIASDNEAGRDIGGRSLCSPDYYSYFNHLLNTAGLGGSAITTGSANYGGGNIDAANHYVIHEGNLTIRGNIVTNATPWANLKDIPQFYLVVKGDVYIAPNVTQLDGIIIAQPKDDGSGGGNIYTCSEETDTGFTINDCATTLTINGAFIAKKVHLNRINGDVRSATNNQGPGNNPNNIAEIFNFSPELWIAEPDSAGAGTRTFGKYNSIVGLPPIL